MASGSFDETIRIWDPRVGGAPIRTIPAHSDPITSLDMTKDGQYLLSSSYDGMVRVWDLRNGRCVETLQNKRVRR